MRNTSKPIQLAGLLSTQPRVRPMRKMLNQILMENPKMEKTIIALTLYPALKWSLYGAAAFNLMKMADSVGWASGLMETKRIFEDVFGFGSPLALKQRDLQFDATETLVSLVDDGISQVDADPQLGNHAVRILNCIINNPEGKPATSYDVQNYTKPVIEKMYALYGKVFDEQVQVLFETSREPQVKDDGKADEYVYAFHNMELLLKEYSRLMWSYAGSQDVIARVLHCKNAEEIEEITEHIGAIYSADKVLQFLLLITGSMALVQYWPIDGSRFAQILKMLTTQREVPQPSGDIIHITEGDIAKGIGLNPSTFSRYKTKSYAVLGLLLWGGDPVIFSNLLLE